MLGDSFPLMRTVFETGPHLDLVSGWGALALDTMDSYDVYKSFIKMNDPKALIENFYQSYFFSLQIFPSWRKSRASN